MIHFDREHTQCFDPLCPLIHACGQPKCGWEISHKRRVAVGADWVCRSCARKIQKREATKNRRTYERS